MRCTKIVPVLVLLACAGIARATDNHITLAANWNGLMHAGEGTNTDDPTGFRSIADRALAVNGGANSFGATALTGNTGITYTIEQNAGVLDMVHLGNTSTSTTTVCTGCPTRWWDGGGLIANRGTQPAYLAGLSDHLNPQTTNVAGLGITLDSLSSVGVLYHVTNGGGTFQVVLGFTDATSVTVTLAANDWFGPVTPPVAGAGVASQALMPANTGTRRTFTGCSNTDLPVVQAYPTQDLCVVEGVISVAEMVNDGLGNFAGKTLQSITFQNPNQPLRGYGIFACTVVNGLGPPANDNCANATPVGAGTITGENVRATGATTSCGSGDTKDVWYAYTAGQTGPVEVRTCGTAMDTTLQVFATCGGPAIACNDNGCGQASRLVWGATAGATYRIRVAANGGAEGPFTLTIDPNPAVHADVAVPLAYNWNGMVHPGEEGQPDNPDGFRSISDRALHASGAPGSINAGPIVGDDFMPYTVSSAAGTLDMVHVGLTGGTAARTWDAVADGDNMGIQPAWLPVLDQSGPQRTDVTSLNVAMGPATRIGVLYHVTNNGGTLDATLEFSDATTATVTLGAPDWYQDQVPPAAGAGVEVQHQLGLFAATSNQDTATTGAPQLNVVEAVFSTSSLLNAGLGSHAGKRITGITFQNPTPNTRGYGVYAATIRDAVPDNTPTNPAGVGSASPNPAEAGRQVTLLVTAYPGTNPVSTGLSVTIDASSLGGAGTQVMFDDGAHNDGGAGDNVFGWQLTLPASQAIGPYALPFTVRDAQLRTFNGTLSMTVNPFAWNEFADGGSDAGDLPDNRQFPVGAGALGAISGELTAGEADMYAIDICDVGAFTASTQGGATLDTQLFLFRPDGTGVAFDDDAAPGTQSMLTSAFVPGPGQYLLAVSQYDHDPIDAGSQELWIDTPFGTERAPDGPGAANPIVSWNGAPIGTGAYRITLTGACFPTSGPVCDSVDFNNDELFPDTQDIDDFLTVFSGGPCTNDPNCNDVDFNNDGLFPDTLDIDALLSVFSGGPCLV
ncbi:MAG: hypothetical protein U0637_01240 [Phycisphaerales bacterium]